MPDIVEVKAAVKRQYEKTGHGFANLGDITVEYAWSAFDGRPVFDMVRVSDRERLDDCEAQAILDARR